MLIRKAYKFRLKINLEQEQKLIQYAGCNRFAWNKFLAGNLFKLQNQQKIFYYQEMNFWLTLWKKSEEFVFLKEAPSQTLQQTLKNLERAFKDAFDKSQPLKRMPKFKKKGISDSFRFPQGFKLQQERNMVFLPKIGWLRYINSRVVIGKVKNMTVSRKGKHWYVSIQSETEQEKNAHESKSMVGIDVGIKRFATLSDGSYLRPLNSFRKLEKKLAKEQRKLSKKQKFSCNWQKQKARIAKIHEHIANARHDYLHKNSSIISKNHAMIVVEDLKVRNMSSSAKGDRENPGINVKAKSGLNKAILDQGWSTFVNFLEYKVRWQGGDLLKVNAHHTSQTCPECSYVSKENRKSQSCFRCRNCSCTENADVVGAKNILERGHRLLACGGKELSMPVKQEPAKSSDTSMLLTV